jgi:ribosomal protein S18 acetylase RimI-like enzyme
MRPYQADVAPRHQKLLFRAMSFVVRPLRPDEPAVYRDIRLEALRMHPEAFGASYEDELARPLDFFAQRVASNTIFAGFRDDAILGTAGFMPESGAKRAHKCHLWGMYVRPEARGTGLARLLVDAVLTHAAARAELIQLSVVSTNGVARRLYESFGFEPFGLEVHSLKVNGRYVDEIHMMKSLTS